MNCNWTGPESAIERPYYSIKAPSQRISPNELVPAGECPECGCLARRAMSAMERRNVLLALKADGLVYAEVVECLGVPAADSPAAAAAKQLYASDDLEFDETVFLSEADGGAWVSCWAWVDAPKEPTMTTRHNYRVTLKESPGDKFTLVFDCSADDSDHAEEQALNAYPGCEILLAARLTEAST